MEETIKFIFPENCYPIRLEVLRKGLPAETAKFSEDFLFGSFHLGYFLEEELAGIVSCCNKEFLHEKNKSAFQLRGMAVLESYRGRSIALQLGKKVEEIAKVFKKEILWCNARTSAVKLYEKLGYKKIGEKFTIPTAGSHFLMYKNLNYNN